MWRASEKAQPLQEKQQQQQHHASVLLFSNSKSVRQWPFVALLVSVVLLGSSPWLYSQIGPKSYDTSTTTEAQDRILSQSHLSYAVRDVVPTSHSHKRQSVQYRWQSSRPSSDLTVEDMLYNPEAVGHSYTYAEAVVILNCTNREWKPKLQAPFAQKRVCPTYFQLIQKDLEPWKNTGITRDNVDMAKKQAFAKFAIIDDKLYIERLRNCYGTRSIFTTWGLLLFLEKYKGQVPDVEFMINCEDRPKFPKSETGPKGPTFMFSYDTRSDYFDVAFPDWTFWGWSDLEIRSWDEQRERIMKGSKRKEWSKKTPKAFWTGNPNVGAPHRKELTKCNHRGKTDVRPQDWNKEFSSGKHNSNLEDQCTYQYMIYTEGQAWSVSFKYILACGSPVLILSPSFYDFFSRGLQEEVSYLPVRPPALQRPELCVAIDEAVKVGEANTTRALEIGKTAQDFMNNDVSMEMVYSYMFHMLLEYSKLQRFKPGISKNSHRLTLDHFQCLTTPRDTPYLHRAMELLPMNSVPCTIPEVLEGEEAFRGYNFEIIPPYYLKQG